MTITIDEATIRQLIEKHVRNLFPGSLVSAAKIQGVPLTFEIEAVIEVADQSPFDPDQATQRDEIR